MPSGSCWNPTVAAQTSIQHVIGASVKFEMPSPMDVNSSSLIWLSFASIAESGTVANADEWNLQNFRLVRGNLPVPIPIPIPIPINVLQVPESGLYVYNARVNVIPKQDVAGAMAIGLVRSDFSNAVWGNAVNTNGQGIGTYWDTSPTSPKIVINEILNLNARDLVAMGLLSSITSGAAAFKVYLDSMSLTRLGNKVPQSSQPNPPLKDLQSSHPELAFPWKRPA